MYERIRTPSVDRSPAGGAEHPDLHRSREEELDIRLAGHLVALLTVTDELRAHTPDPALDDAAAQLATHAARLMAGREPLRAAPSPHPVDAAHVAALHQRAHMLAGHALVVATARDDASAPLAAARLDAHAHTLPTAA